MLSKDQYQLIDFGSGHKLERFANTTVLRPCPAADFCQPEGQPLARQSFDLRFAGTESTRIKPTDSRWSGKMPSGKWTIGIGNAFRMNLSTTPYGHVGLFPEQAVNWRWLCDLPNRFSSDPVGIKAINLFAYTGASTLALAGAGFQVTHVDAAANTVKRARSNAALSQLDDRPVRWICEDVMTFVEREIKRGNRYDIVIADPPAFGHGPKKQQWRIREHIEPLVERLVELTGGKAKAVLMTSHTSGFESATMAGLISGHFGLPGSRVERGNMSLTTATGRKLNAGYYARWCESER